MTYKYRSRFEAKVAKQLEDAGVAFGYETEKIEYSIPESRHYYKPDFVLENGIIIETKGIFDYESRYKMQMVKEQWPQLDIRILLYRDQPIRKNSKTLYSDICKTLGYEYAVGDVPAKWLKKNKKK